MHQVENNLPEIDEKANKIFKAQLDKNSKLIQTEDEKKRSDAAPRNSGE